MDDLQSHFELNKYKRTLRTTSFPYCQKCYKVNISLWLSIACILAVATKRRHDEGRDIGGYVKCRQSVYLA